MERISKTTIKEITMNEELQKAAELSANGAVISRQSSIDGRVIYNLDERCFSHSDLVKQFIAGAKWMEKQLEKENRGIFTS